MNERRGLPRPDETAGTTAAPRPLQGPRSPSGKSPRALGPLKVSQWLVLAVLLGLAATLIVGAVVIIVRMLVGLQAVQDFVATYPGEYALPETAPIGIPAWLGWQHFFNTFLTVLIIQSGLRIRTVKRPTVFWSRRSAGSKVSLMTWFHQSLDLLWLLNGVVFVVLLFVTGQWMRIVPTSWDVIPNAITAGLRYASLAWPTENGWVNYNSLQQLTYFATVFVAAPLAVLTGVRMSTVWPRRIGWLNQAYPIELARAVHLPVMLFFVLFLIVHVALVLATGALRNLNHMYATRDDMNWAGFWIFVGSLIAMALACIAARPVILVPVARLFGTVSR